MKSNNTYIKIVAILMVCIVSLQLTGCGRYADLQINNTSSAGQISSAVSSDSQTEETSAVPSESSQLTSSASISSTPPKSAASKSASKVKTPQVISETEDLKAIKRLSVQKAALSSESYTPVNQNSGYQSLTSEPERTLYKLIGNSVYQVANTKTSSGYAPVGQISIPAKLTEAQIRLTVTAYLDDHPQVFWIANAFSYAVSGNQTILQLYSELTQRECNAALLAFNGKVQSILQSIPSGLSEFEREEYLFDYITSNCVYTDTADGSDENWKLFTAYGALVDGQAVCEGYSRAMLLLSGYVGLPCVLIRGTGDGIPHMWNGIKIDGNWYHLDLTWCDSSHLVYNYFNINDSTLKLTHTIAPIFSSLTDEQICSSGSIFNLTLPVCSSTDENYFQKKGIVISTLDSSADDEVVTAIATQMKMRKTTIAFHIAAGDYDTIIKDLLSAKPYKMASYLKSAADQAGVTLNWQNISYVTDKANMGLNVFIAYQ
jgi:transglutaminase/protease-like cytokinesis protein 3